MFKGKLTLRVLLFLTLCVDFGVVAKVFITPFSNVLTDFMHIPGGIGTAFSLLPILAGRALMGIPGSAFLMCFLQSILALFLGSGSAMGVLAPVAFCVPGVVIDVFPQKRQQTFKMSFISWSNL